MAPLEVWGADRVGAGGVVGGVMTDDGSWAGDVVAWFPEPSAGGVAPDDPPAEGEPEVDVVAA